MNSLNMDDDDSCRVGQSVCLENGVGEEGLDDERLATGGALNGYEQLGNQTEGGPTPLKDGPSFATPLGHIDQEDVRHANRHQKRGDDQPSYVMEHLIKGLLDRIDAWSVMPLPRWVQPAAIE